VGVRLACPGVQLHELSLKGADVLAELGQFGLDRLPDAIGEVLDQVSDFTDLAGHVGGPHDRVAAADEYASTLVRVDEAFVA
jgi:hypothetical protein